MLTFHLTKNSRSRRGAICIELHVCTSVNDTRQQTAHLGKWPKWNVVVVLVLLLNPLSVRLLFILLFVAVDFLLFITGLAIFSYGVLR